MPDLAHPWTRFALAVVVALVVAVLLRRVVPAFLRGFALRTSGAGWRKSPDNSQILGSAMQLRALMSSSNSGKSWDLRCKVREGLIDYVRREFPDFLPRVRGEMVSDVRMADAGTPAFGRRMTFTRR